MTASLLLVAEVGRIQGGWGYVWTAYGLAWSALALYTLSLWLRRPRKEP
ncbi:MAG: hypothetical protein ACLQDQ_13380 [Myxococcaceae bacterium]